MAQIRNGVGFHNTTAAITLKSPQVDNISDVVIEAEENLSLLFQVLTKKY